MSNQLILSRYWNIPVSSEIKTISERLQAVYQDRDPGPIDVDESVDVEKANQAILERKKLTRLPFREQLEDEFQRDLSWLKIRKGESEAMRLIQEDWLVVGDTLFFGDEQPNYQQVRTAISSVISKRKVST